MRAPALAPAPPAAAAPPMGAGGVGGTAATASSQSRGVIGMWDSTTAVSTRRGRKSLKELFTNNGPPRRRVGEAPAHPPGKLNLAAMTAANSTVPLVYRLGASLPPPRPIVEQLVEEEHELVERDSPTNARDNNIESVAECELEDDDVTDVDGRSNYYVSPSPERGEKRDFLSGVNVKAVEVINPTSADINRGLGELDADVDVSHMVYTDEKAHFRKELDEEIEAELGQLEVEEKHYDLGDSVGANTNTDANTPHLHFDNFSVDDGTASFGIGGGRLSLGASGRSNFLDNVPPPHEADEAAVERVLHTIHNNSATHLVQSGGGASIGGHALLGTISELDAHLHPIFEHEDEDILSDVEGEDVEVPMPMQDF